MKYKQLLILAVASATATTGWTAEPGRTSKHEAIGLGSGAVIGAAAGGPIGFVIGAAFGGFLGDRFEAERTGRIEAEERYAEVRAEADELESLLARNEREIAQMAAHMAAQVETERLSHVRSLEEALNLQVYFRTAQAAVEPGAAERLARIGELVRAMEGAVVLLEGHADPRGDAQYNVELSQARAESVRQIFMEAGVPEHRIAITAEGESQSEAPVDDVDALALDRRVSISIVGQEQRVAQRFRSDR